MSQATQVLTVNCGSASVKFALYEMGLAEHRRLYGRCDGIGLGKGRCLLQDEGGRVLFESSFGLPDPETAALRFLDWLNRHSFGSCIGGVGHRVVNGGMRFERPVAITPEIDEELGKMGESGPDNPAPEIRAMRVLRGLLPQLTHVACFDTAFHRGMPPVAQRHPLPRELSGQGIVRFGFHGLSCESILATLAAEVGEGASRGRIVIAHLGSSASMAAFHGGRSLDTTMGFSPNGGLMMGTRSGDLCPGVLLYLLQGKNLSAAEVGNIVNKQSGLLGVSGVSRDMQELLKVSPTNPDAAEAVALFCYTARKHLGSLAAVLGGLDTLVFSGGIGENAPAVRKGICEQMEFLGIRLDMARNRQNASVISSGDSPVTVRVVATNEELMIARATDAVVRSLTQTTQV